MFGGRRKESQIRRDLKKAPATEPDTHNKVIRCGIENAPLLTVIVGPYMDHGNFQHDTARVNSFLRYLRKRGFDISLIHLFEPSGRPVPHDQKNNYTGFVQVMFDGDEMFYSFDAQNLRHLQKQDQHAREMVRDTHAAYRHYISTYGRSDSAEITDSNLLADEKSGDGASHLKKGVSFAVDHEEHNPLERDTHNKIVRCGTHNAPLLMLYLCPYQNHSDVHTDLRRVSTFLRYLLLCAFDVHIVHIPADQDAASKDRYNSLRVEFDGTELFYSADAQHTHNVHKMASDLAEEMSREVDRRYRDLILKREHQRREAKHAEKEFEGSVAIAEEESVSHIGYQREDPFADRATGLTHTPVKGSGLPSPDGKHHPEHIFLKHNEPVILRDLEQHHIEPVTHNQLMRTAAEGAPELTVVIGPYKSVNKIHHDTLRVNKFLRLLLQRGFDLHVQHAQMRRKSISSENHGFVEVYWGKVMLMYHHDAQHTRNLSQSDLINNDMLEEVLEMYNYYAEEKCRRSDSEDGSDSEEDGDYGSGSSVSPGGHRREEETGSSLRDAHGNGHEGLNFRSYGSKSRDNEEKLSL